MAYLDRLALLTGLGLIVLGRLSLAGRWQCEVGEVEFAALGIGSNQISFLGVEEGERLAARPVRVHAHLRSGVPLALLLLTADACRESLLLLYCV